MDFQNRAGGKTGTGGVASAQEAGIDRRERLRKLALETIDLSKDPYFMRNHIGTFECKLCLTLHNNEGSYLAHTQGKKHQSNLARRAAKEAADVTFLPAPQVSKVELKKFVKIGRPGYKVTRERDPESGQQALLFQIDYPEIADGISPRHRFMSAYEQKIQPPDKRWQYLLFAAEPYETISFKIPSREVDKSEKFWTMWNKETKQFFLQVAFKIERNEDYPPAPPPPTGENKMVKKVSKKRSLQEEQEKPAETQSPSTEAPKQKKSKKAAPPAEPLKEKKLNKTEKDTPSSEPLEEKKSKKAEKEVPSGETPTQKKSKKSVKETPSSEPSKEKKSKKAEKEAPSAETPTQKKSKKPVKETPSSEPSKEKKSKKAEKNAAPAAEAYQPGGLSSLFGKSTEGAVILETVVEGNEKVEKKVREVVKTAEKTEKSSETTETPIEKTDSSNRKQQRENKKKAKETKKSSAEDKEKTVFVGNMPLSMNEKVVKKIFSEYGRVQSVRLRNLVPATKKVTQRVTHLSGKLNENQTSLIFYVKFETKESATKALEYNGTKLEDHTIRVDTCTGKKVFDRDFSIFVGNIAFDATEDSLIDFFTKEIGEVQGVRIIRDKQTGNGKGFAFINFKSEASATLALSMETIKMEKREIRITKVMKKKQIEKVMTAKKRSSKNQQQDNMNPQQKTKLEQFKFSTRKNRSNEQNERRMLKKSAKKAIKKKKSGQKGRLMQ